VKRSRQAPDAQHPLGYGRALYFWSFMVALLLFTGGGVFSVYEGIHKIIHPEEPHQVWIGLVVLGVSLALEGGATVSNIRQLNARRGKVPFFEYLRRTKDSDLIVIFGENSAASLGLLLAGLALGMAWVTHDGRWDAVGSLLVGIVLLGVAIFLAIEVKSLLLGEAADPEVEQAARAVAEAHPDVDEVLRVLTIQQGPGEVMVALKLRMSDKLPSARAVAEAINSFERELRAKCPQVRWSFVEPDVADGES
jgi:cation diffusion facilitator family transporter